MNFKALNLTQSGIAQDSPMARPQPTLGVDFDTSYEIQARKMRVSQTYINNFIQNSGTATASGSFGNGQALNINTGLTPNVPFQNFPNFADPYIALYQGTSAVGSMQIYPFMGSGVVTSNYKVWSGFNYTSFDGVGSFYTVHVENVAAGAVSIFFISQWKYIFYNTGNNA